MFYFIYKTTNLINKKYYIGQHKTKNINDGYLGSGTLLRYALKKYGKENFTREILAYAESAEQLNELQAFYVNKQVMEDQNSYNLMTGGYQNIQVSEHTKQKLRQIMTGRILTADWKRKIGLGNKGKGLGKKRNIETKNKMSFSHKGKTFSEQHKNNIRQARKGIVFSSQHKNNLSVSHGGRYFYSINLKTNQKTLQINQSECAKKIGISDSSIYKVLKGKMQSAKGYKFVYVDDYSKNKEVIQLQLF